MLNKLPITLLLSFAFAFVLALLAGIGLYGMSSLNVIDRHLELITENLQKRYTLTMRMRQAARERSLSMHRIILVDDPFEQDEEWMRFNRHAANFAQAREELVLMGLSDDELVHLDEQGVLIQKNITVQDRLVELALNDQRDEATELLITQAMPTQDEVFSHLHEQLALYEGLLHEEREEAGKEFQRLASVGWVAGGFALFMGVLVAAWSVKRIGGDQRELIAHEREQGEIIDGMLTGVLTMNEQGIIESFNRAAMKMFGYRAEEVVGKSINVFIPAHAHQRHQGYLAAYFEHEDTALLARTREVNAVRADGSTFPMRIMLSRIPPGDDGRKRIVASCFDISDQKEQELRLRSSQKMDALGQLTGGIAHDYNNMLAVILGYTDLLKMRTSEGEPIRHYIDEIHQAAERGTRLTSKLLSFTRRKPIEESTFELNELLLEDRLMLEKTLTASVNLTMDLDEHPCRVSLDRDDLENAILNIAINARHAMPNGGNLHISTTRRELGNREAESRGVEPGPAIELLITDSGVGMDEETVNRIFEPFYSTKGDKGTGLGMSQVYGFVQRSGGDVSVKSQPGVGTQFSLLFPCVDTATAGVTSGGQKGDIETVVPNKRILIVDDEEAICSLAADMLSSDGHQVLTVGSAEEALQILEHETVDLLLTDVIMPGMSGFALATEVARRYPEIKLQLMSGYSDNIDSSEVEPELLKQLLHKPFNLNELRGRIQQLFK